MKRGSIFTVFSDMLLITMVFLVLYINTLSVETTEADEIADGQMKTIVTQNEKIDGHKKKVETQAAAIDGFKNTVAKQGKEIGELERQVAMLKKGKPVDFVAAIDASGSMTNAIARLKRALKMLADLLPRVTDLRVGIVVYREDKVWTFPLQRIATRSEDDGTSYQELEAFLDGVECKNAIANVGEGVNAALAMFKPSVGDDRRRCVFALLGDVGPGEYWNEQRRPALRSQAEQQSARDRIVDAVNDWSETHGEDGRVLALYSGHPKSDQRAFYEQLGRVQGGTFSDQPTGMFQTVFVASYPGIAKPKE